MTNDDSTNDDSKKVDLAKGDSTNDERSERRRRRAERAEQMRKERERAERRQRSLISGAIVLVVVLLIGVGWYAVKQANDSKQTASTVEGSSDKVVKPTVDVAKGITIQRSKGVKLKAGAPKVELFEDFLCPACESFEKQNREQLQSMAAAGEIQLTYFPLAILDVNQAVDRKHYSSRSASAAICAVESGGSAAFEKAHNALYAHQPDEAGKTFPSNKKLLSTLTSAGITFSDKSCVLDSRYAGYVRNVMTGITNTGASADNAKSSVVSKRKITATPTMMINGKASDAFTAAQVKAAIAKASD